MMFADSHVILPLPSVSYWFKCFGKALSLLKA